MKKLALQLVSALLLVGVATGCSSSPEDPRLIQGIDEESNLRSGGAITKEPENFAYGLIYDMYGGKADVACLHLTADALKTAFPEAESALDCQDLMQDATMEAGYSGAVFRDIEAKELKKGTYQIKVNVQHLEMSATSYEVDTEKQVPETFVVQRDGETWVSNWEPEIMTRAANK